MSAGDWKDMMSAIQKGQIEIVKYHISNGVNPNFEHPEYFTTPLVESILHERIDVIQYLLDNGADPTIKSGFQNQSPLRIAQEKRCKEIIELIRKYTPNPKKPFLEVFWTKWRSIF